MEEPAEPHNRFAKIKRDLAIIKWMLGVNLAAVAVLVIKAFA
jgi:hypothetical protein